MPRCLGLLPTVLLALAVPASSAEIRFRAAAAEWGLEFRHHAGGSGKRYHPETNGSGVVLFDFDHDGDLDVLFVDGAPLPGYEGEPPRSILYRNDGADRFVDWTGPAGLAIAGYGMGASSADYDDDGDLDIYVAHFRENQLFRNNGDGTFEDFTASAGVGDPRWSMTGAFGDLDRDGDLDLYVTNYVEYSLENPILCYNEIVGVSAFCHPELFEALHNRYYRNRGDGTFEDWTEPAGFSVRSGKSMGVAVVDLDDDGWLDLYVANDTTPNSLFLNRGDGTFQDESLLSGTAFGDQGLAEAGMGLAVGDVDGDLRVDLYVTNYALETNALYRNLGGRLFTDTRNLAGVAQPSLILLGFGTSLGDFDLDADLDLVVANGHILDNVELMEERADLSYRQPNQLLENDGAGRFSEVADGGLEVVASSRGLAVGDLDGDFDLDLVVSNSNDLAEVYENVTETDGGWLAVDLGAVAGSPSAIGSRLMLWSGQRRQRRDLMSTDSYLSQSGTTLRFGLADAAVVERLEIRWSDGREARLLALPGNRRVRLWRRAGR